MSANSVQRITWPTIVAIAIAALVVGFIAFGLWLANPPVDFPVGSIFHVDRGESMAEVGASLERTNVIKSALLLRLYMKVTRTDRSLQPGDYLFAEEISIFKVAKRLAHGEFGLAMVKVTIPEGSTTEDMAAILGDKLHNFSSSSFLALAKPLEGYLFPDTYFFSPLAPTAEILAAMQENFRNKIVRLQSALAQSGKSLSDVITMASLVEKEANTPESRALIAGILWKRLENNMPLQVDAGFDYFLHKTSRELTRADLEVDSPYNTYKYKGLPLGPIANPGLGAIEATLFPMDSQYFYYLSDNAGEIHYAVDLEAHKKNRAKYLN